jgi:hypothetical protein
VRIFSKSFLVVCGRQNVWGKSATMEKCAKDGPPGSWRKHFFTKIALVWQSEKQNATKKLMGINRLFTDAG